VFELRDGEVKLGLPRRQKGRHSREREAEYHQRRTAFCRLILQTRSRMDFRVGSRGWCYVLEEHGLVKGDFDRAEDLIADCRKRRPPMAQ
jgi:hypothetical protein